MFTRFCEEIRPHRRHQKKNGWASLGKLLALLQTPLKSPLKPRDPQCRWKRQTYPGNREVDRKASADDGALECRPASGTLSLHLLCIVLSRVRLNEALTNSTSSEAFMSFSYFYRATNRGRYHFFDFSKEKCKTKTKPVMAGRKIKIEKRIWPWSLNTYV